VDEVTQLALVSATGFAITCLVVPGVAKVATATGFLDHPSGYKEHQRPTPYLGGLAVVIGFLGSSLVFADALAEFRVPAICVLLLLIVGTVDDSVNLGIAPRLAVEIGVAVVVWTAGQGWQLGSSAALELIVTVGWVVGLINAYNLMDNLDGATPTVAATSGIGVGVLAAVQGDPMLAAICFALASACLGFLPHNLARPSKIFLGDGGSMPIGFILAVAVMMVPQNALGLPALAIGALLVGVPLLDMAAVIVSRRRRGVGVFVGGRDHMTHRLFLVLDSERLVAGTLAGGQGTLCVVAVILSQRSSGTMIVGLSILFLSIAVVGIAAIGPIGSWWKSSAS